MSWSLIRCNPLDQSSKVDQSSHQPTTNIQKSGILIMEQSPDISQSKKSSLIAKEKSLPKIATTL